MPDAARLHRDRRKLRFLKAFARIGSIAGAAKASRISRDAAHDWINGDLVFAHRLAAVKLQRHHGDLEHLESALVFFQHCARPLVPAALWPRIASALTLAMLRLKTDLRGADLHRALPSEMPTGATLAPITFDGVASFGCVNVAPVADFAAHGPAL